MLVGLLNDELSGIEIMKQNEGNKENEDINKDAPISSEIATFMNIKKKLTEMGKTYNKKFEEIMPLFEQASCRYDVLEDFLSNNKSTNKMWKSLEDFVLVKPHMNEEAFNMLLNDKGEEEIQNRKKFLNLK